MAGDGQTFQSELMKLLLQVACADDEIQPEEARVVIDIARNLGLDEAEIAQVEAHLIGELPLPAPDLNMLRARRQEVVDAVKRVVMADHVLAPGEKDVLEEIARVLNKPEAK